MTVRVSTSDAPVLALDGAASAIASARRAVLADRYAAHSLSVEWRDFSALSPIADAWRDLAACALQPNVFYEPAFALAAAPVFGRGAGALLVWSGASPRQLLGFFPARLHRRRYGFGPAVLLGLTHAYGPYGVPLVAREAAEPVIAAWLGHLAADKALPALLLLPFVDPDGPFAATLTTILRRAQMPYVDRDRHQRALLQPQGERALYVDHALSRHRRKEIGRQARRLAELGAVLFTAATEPDAVAIALGDFFALEAAGWKGRQGTATADHAALRRFVQDAVGGLAGEGKVAIHRLMLDGRAIAAAIVLRSGRCAWFWKIAYDEDYARFSPGVMLSVALTDDLAADEALARIDSCATAGHPMIDHLWRERLTLASRLIAVRPQAPFSLVRRLEGLRGVAIAGAKGLRGGLRRRLGR